ncbi:MAG: hypothetical protein JRH11_10315 [Deltaproteobacteria bacterium]|nr:hypothetical protein [Deltaproteobacteria bacterium]
MSRMLRDGSGSLLVVSALGVLFMAVRQLGGHDYVAAILLVLVGQSLLWAGVELLRPTIGE